MPTMTIGGVDVGELVGLELAQRGDAEHDQRHHHDDGDDRTRIAKSEMNMDAYKYGRACGRWVVSGEVMSGGRDCERGS